MLCSYIFFLIFYFTALRIQVEKCLPNGYKQKQVGDAKVKYVRHPLPCQSNTVHSKEIARTTISEIHSRRQIRHKPPTLHWNLFAAILFCLVVLVATIAGVVWLYHGFSEDKNMDTLFDLWKYLIDHVWNHSTLDVKQQATVSNIFIVITVHLCLMFGYRRRLKLIYRQLVQFLTMGFQKLGFRKWF